MSEPALFPVLGSLSGTWNLGHDQLSMKRKRCEKCFAPETLRSTRGQGNLFLINQMSWVTVGPFLMLNLFWFTHSHSLLISSFLLCFQFCFEPSVSPSFSVAFVRFVYEFRAIPGSGKHPGVSGVERRRQKEKKT